MAKTISPKALKLTQQAASLHQSGQLAEAASAYKKSLELEPKNSEALRLYGLLQLQNENYSAAISLTGKAIKLNPQEPSARLFHGIALNKSGKAAEAIPHLNFFLDKQPNAFDALFNRGCAHVDLKNYELALIDFTLACKLNPQHLLALEYKANTLLNLKRFDEAISAYQQCLAVNPAHNIALFNLGMTYRDWNRPKESLDAFSHLLLINPNHKEGLYQKASALQKLGHFKLSADTYKKLQTIAPDFPHVSGMEMYSLLHICDWGNYQTNREKIISGVEEQKHVDTPFPFLAISSSAAAQLDCSRLFCTTIFQDNSKLIDIQPDYRTDKIRIAYVSADFGDHPVSYLLTGLFEHHDRQRFEIYGISLQPAVDTPTGRRVKASFDHWLDASMMDDLSVARFMREQQVVIAVDLGGHTKNSRSEIFSYRAAPIQVNYIGYPGTMGSNFHDYIIADQFVIPEAQQRFYSEKIAYLPECFQANDDQRIVGAAPSRSALGLPENSFIFCSFHISNKINPAIFDSWMRILDKTPNSIIWLLAREELIADNLRREAAQRGIDPSRLYFAPRVSYEEYLARYQAADLFLDTLPFNAGTTASDALWAGLPVLTCTGEALASRYAGSLLKAVGLDELITESLVDYEALAIKLATTPDLLATLRQRLAQNRNTYPLFNTARFTRHMEAAYTIMWERYQRREKPATFHV